MKIHKLIVLLFVFSLVFTNKAAVVSQSSAGQNDFVVTVDWLKEHLDHKKLVLLHVGNEDDFKKEHIPGAQFISLRDVSTTREENELRLELPPVERLKEKFEGLGVGNESRIVLYWGKDWVTPTTRIFFTLDVLGLAERVSILDGGMPAWTAAGQEVTSEVKVPQKGELKISRRDLVAKQSELIDAILNSKPITIIDARDNKYYTGEDKGSMPRAGHIPNAQNIPYRDFVTEDLKFKDKKTLQSMFEKAGAKTDVPVVTYCHIGQQASLAYFAARMLGFKVRIYDGSYQEWSSSDARVVLEKKQTDQ